MSTHDLYTIPAELSTWDVEDGRSRPVHAGSTTTAGTACWPCTRRARTSSGTPPSASTGASRSIRTTCSASPTRPSRSTTRRSGTGWTTKQRKDVRLHSAAWQFSQFLHGEQGAMICSARIVESVPDLDSKFYAATQTMDEARHAETYARFLQEKVGLVYPINQHLKSLLDAHAQRLPVGHALPGHAGADRGPRPGRVRRDARHHHQAAAQADPRLRDAGRGPARGLRPDGAARLLRPADRGRAARARGLRHRGLLPDARPAARPGALGDPGPEQGRGRRGDAGGRPSPTTCGCSGRCCSAGSSRASRTSGCGARGCSRPTWTWACWTWPARTWTR